MFLNTAVWIKVMLAILVAFVVSIALTPFVKRLAVKVGAVDVPGEARRVHDHPIPRMGGLAIFLGFIVSTLLFADITQEVRGILIGSIIIVITGVIDDIVSLRAWTKFLIQILAGEQNVQVRQRPQRHRVPARPSGGHHAQVQKGRHRLRHRALRAL